jgi:G3E family GTPase
MAASRQRSRDDFGEGESGMSDRAYALLEERQRERGIRLEEVKEKLKVLKVETPSWGYGDSGTRFKVFKQVGVPSAGWIRELENGHHTPETEEYGISSFVYERRRPFHPERLMNWMSDWSADIVRAKGTVWLATRNEMAQSLSQAGPSIQFGPAGFWVAALPEEERRELLREEPELAENWDEEFGDRVNKIVFIGIEMDREQIVAGLDACLLSDEEMKVNWKTFIDKFPNVPHEQTVSEFAG